MHSDDTIAAISTPPGRGGIGVVRLSGPQSLEIANTIFHSASGKPISEPNRAQFGHLIDPSIKEPIDEIVITFFRAPHSYTGEDIVELSCHGSPVILRRALDLIVSRGARIAEPGEFTLRAFFNRRIDLAQAQAVRDLINAQTEYQARLATRQLEGAMAKRLEPIKQTIIDIVVHMESSVEFVEDDISPEALSQLLAKLNRIIEELTAMATSFSFGRYVKEGFDLAIIGRPNVGKSSVFNRLIGSQRAIVTELPGTTRDALYESASISGIPVRLIDTAGIRETSDVVESIGIERSRAAIADADIILLVIDASASITEDDLRLLDQIHEDRRIIVFNKCDLPFKIDFSYEASFSKSIRISALSGEGFHQLTEAILHRLSGNEASERDDLMITDARQEQVIKRTIELLDEARTMIIQGDLEEIILLRLHSALLSLGELTGETLTEDILGQIFSTFCIGK